MDFVNAMPDLLSNSLQLLKQWTVLALELRQEQEQAQYAVQVKQLRIQVEFAFVTLAFRKATTYTVQVRILL